MTAGDPITWPGAILDITAPLRQGMAVWPGDPPVHFDAWGDQSDARAPRVTRVSFGTHTGAHIDAPAHVLPGGATVDQLPLAAMVGSCLVVETDAWPAISASDLESLGIPLECRRLLIRTRASHRGQDEGSNSGSAGVTAGAADWLVARGIALVGIDCPSIEGEVEGTADPAETLPVHRRLLAAGIVVVEGLLLKCAGAGPYLLVSLPLKLQGLDGAPVRAILLPVPAEPPGTISLATECHSSPPI